MSYDRAVVKVDLAKAKAAAFGRFPTQVPLAATSEHSPQTWHSRSSSRPRVGRQPTSTTPAGPRRRADSAKGTPGAVIGTLWTSGDIWLRRHFNLPAAIKGDLALRMHHDEDAEVYLNGTLIAEQKKHTVGYYVLRLDDVARAA